MIKTTSEQLPNDGAYHIKRLVKEANDRLKQIGKHGKRASIVAKKSSLSLQFSFKDGNGNPQKNVGLGAIPVSANGILEAERLAQMVTNQLTANQFSWDWFHNLIGKDTSEQSKQLTCKEMLIEYKKHYFKQRKDNKNPDHSWYGGYRYIEAKLNNLDKPISLSIVREIVEATENNSDARKLTLNGLVSFLKFFENNNFKNVIKEYKNNCKVIRKKRSVPNDKRIIEIYNNGFIIKPKVCTKYRYRYAQWQFLYGLLATYGLRIHEAWNIANWNKPVTLKNGDWVTVDIDNDNSINIQKDSNDIVIPAILDSSNTNHLLCIKHDTKTGYRIAMPLSPNGHDWVKEFNLSQPFNLPDIENALHKIGKNKTVFKCSKQTSKWFSEHNYGFTAHDLRHAYNHRGHQLGYNHKALADSLGHSVTMNSTGYLRHMSDNVKLQGIKDPISKEQSKRSEVDELKAEVASLKAQLEAALKENELLQTKIRLNEAYKDR